MKKTQNLIKQLFNIVADLERIHKDRKFTLDGHLVGSIGEVWAAEKYHLTLLPASFPIHDAKDSSNQLWQIKNTSRDRVGLRSCPDNLLVLKLHSDGSISEVYSGKGKVAWKHAGKMQKNGQAMISLSKLKAL